MKLFFGIALLVILAGVACTGEANDNLSQRRAHFKRLVEILEDIVDDLRSQAVTASEKGKWDEAPMISMEPIESSGEPMVSIEPATPEPEATSESIAPNMPYEVHVVNPVTDPPTSAVIILHGLNSSAEEVLPLVESIRLALPRTRFILPKAPIRNLTAINRGVSAWYDVLSIDPTGPQADEEITQAAQNVADIASIQQLELGISADKVALVGLSQGGAVCLTAYLRYDFGATVAISSYLPLMYTYPLELASESITAPLLMIHGSEDKVVPVEVSRNSAAFIHGLGRNVKFLEIAGLGHSLEMAFDKVLKYTVQTLKIIE